MKKVLLILAVAVFTVQMYADNLRTEDINIRDPFILVDNGRYYMYASAGQGKVKVYTGTDLENWSEPQIVLNVPSDNWSNGVIWAPEVHKYRGRYYMFATINSPEKWKKSKEGWVDYTYRGTQIFCSKSPEGPFEAISNLPQTPMDYMALDGTLYVEDGKPYMVFSHEWVQVQDGTMEYEQLSRDLSHAVSAPVRMFCASAAPVAPEGQDSYVTDGCFMYRTKTGKLLMIWATFGPEGYAECIAESVTGRISGPWRQQTDPLFSKDGGHAMIFIGLDGHLRLVLHSPNGPSGSERARFFLLEDTGDTLRIVSE